MTDQLPAKVQPGALATPTDTYIVPALIADAGNAVGWGYVEFFTANINNDHGLTRAHAIGSSAGASTTVLRSWPFGRCTWRRGSRNSRRNTGRRA
jgi:hypothetical protein